MFETKLYNPQSICLEHIIIRVVKKALMALVKKE